MQSTWQRLKPIGEKLWRELSAHRSTAQARTALRLIEGKLIEQGGEGVGENATVRAAVKILNLLAGMSPKEVSDALNIADCWLTQKRLPPGEADRLEKLFKDLRGEFDPAALRIILKAADRAAKASQKRQATEQRKD